MVNPQANVHDHSRATRSHPITHNPRDCVTNVILARERHASAYYPSSFE